MKGITVCCDGDDSFIEELLFLASKKKKQIRKKRAKPLVKKLFNSIVNSSKMERR